MKRILIVEDDRFIADVYQTKLRANGLVVDTAGDGRAGLQLFDRHRPDAVLVDLMLPEINGVELIRSMRSRTGAQQLPIIVLSNAYLGGIVRQAWEAGASQVLTKASPPGQVVQAVENALDLSPCVSNEETEAEFVPHIRELFFRDFAETLTILRRFTDALRKSPKEAAPLQNLYRTVRSVATDADLAGAGSVSRLASALECLLKTLWEKPEHVTASTVRTISQAIDLLGNLTETTDPADPSAARILVLDDGSFAQREVVDALERTHFRPTSVSSPEAALQLVAENPFDVIFLNVETSDRRLCESSQRHATPLVFLTQGDEFERRIKSMTRDGNDLIAKPFLYAELEVKTLTLVMRRRMTDEARVGTEELR
jgi:DNA-binding response OmpR family regulator